MKKFFSVAILLLLCIALVVSLAACQSQSKPAASSESGSTASASDIRADFKKAMDSYEAFVDEYCEFMEKYKENPTDAALISEYPEFLEKLGEMEKDFEKWDHETLSTEEAVYYAEVASRVAEKTAKVAQDLVK